MKTAEELWELLSQTEDMSYGPARTALAEQLLRHVDGAGDPRLAFFSRLIATNSFVYGGEPAKAFVTFSWCISDFDNNPQPYHQRAVSTLLWVFKSIVNGLTKFPEVPLARTYAVLDDMERRYREYGQGMQALYKYRYVVAEHVGLRDEADSWFERWQSAPRDQLSDCIGCDPTDVAEYLSSRGRYADAVALAEPVLAGELTCIEQPQRILSELMVPYLLTGRADQAADAHRRSYRLERGNIADMSDIAAHIVFCARTGNEHRGLELLQRHIDWLDKAPSPAAAMEFASAGGLLLRRITELGHGDATVRRLGRDDITAADLGTELSTQATDLARRFDARNGTDTQGRRIAERLAAGPFEVPLVLSPTARQSAAAAEAPSVTAPVEPAPEVPAEASPAELLDLAEEHYNQDRDAALTATLTALQTRFPQLDDQLQAARHEVLLGDQRRLKDQDGVVEHWTRAVELFTAAGAPAKAGVVRARIALEEAHADKFDEEPIRADVAYQDEHGGPAERAAAWARLSIVHFLRDRYAEANEAGDRADGFAEQTGDVRMIAMHTLLRARNRIAADRHDEAVAAARSALAFFREHGPGRRVAEAAIVSGHLTADPAEQLELFGTAIAVGRADQALAARIGRGHALLQLDRAGEAVPDLVEAVALCAEQGLEQGGAFARRELAHAYRLSGRPVEAAEVAEEALLINERLGLDEAAADVRFLLAGLYREIGDSNGALAAYRDLIERLADNPAGRGQIGEEVGALLYDLDRDGEAAEAFGAASASLYEAGDPIGGLRAMRRQVSALHYADEPARAEEVVRRAEERFAALPAELATEPNAIWQRSMIAFELSRVLMARERHAEAIPHLRGVPERLRTIGAADDADRVETMYAEALLRTGSATEAEALLRAQISRLPEDAPTREMVTELHEEARAAVKSGRRSMFRRRPSTS